MDRIKLIQLNERGFLHACVQKKLVLRNTEAPALFVTWRQRRACLIFITPVYYHARERNFIWYFYTLLSSTATSVQLNYTNGFPFRLEGTQ